jgi:hypothetical protein
MIRKQEIDMNKLASKINGAIQILISFVFVFFHCELFYGYNFTNNLYLVMIPNWIIVVNILLGIVGIHTGLWIYRNKLKIWKGYVLQITILIFGSLLDTITVI